MRQFNCEIFAYVDDFIIVSHANDAELHYKALFDLFSDLGLPMNQDKLSNKVSQCVSEVQTPEPYNLSV